MRWSSLFVPTGFLVSCRTSRYLPISWFRLQGSNLLCLSFPKHSTIKIYVEGIWLLQFRSSLLSESFLLSFPHPTKIFQFGWSRLDCSMPYLLYGGFSHSDSFGSSITYISPKRFAVRRVLLRLIVPQASTVRPFFLNLFYLILFFFISNFFLILRLFYLIFKDLFSGLSIRENYIRLLKRFIAFLWVTILGARFSLERRWSIPTFS